jgi:hypothetical protein
MPLLIGYSPSFASAKQKHSGASSSSGGGNNTGQTGSNNGGSTGGGNTGSTNQQQCPKGEHFDNKKNKCVKDTSNQQSQGGTMSTRNSTTPVTCVGETHQVAKTGQCVSNSIPLPDGSCVAGYHLVIGSEPPLCVKDTPTQQLPSKQSNNTGTGGGGGNGTTTGTGPTLTGGVPPSSPSFPATQDNARNLAALTCFGETHSQLAPPPPPELGNATLRCVSNSIPLPDGSCVAGYHLTIGRIPPECTLTATTVNELPLGIVCVKGTHYDQQSGKCLDQNGLITNLVCTGETHANPLTNMCEPDSQHLPSGLDPWHNGGCTKGYHIDNVLDPTGHTCYPDTTTGATTTTTNTTATQDNARNLGGLVCVKGTHYDQQSGKCLDQNGLLTNLAPQATTSGAATVNELPLGIVCVKGTHYDQQSGKCLDQNGLLTNNLVCTGETHANALVNKCEGNDQRLPAGLDPNGNGGCTKGYHTDNARDPTGHTCYPDTTTGATTANALPPGLLCGIGLHLDLKTGKCYDQNGIYTNLVCTGETHYDPLEKKCVGNDKPLPGILGGQCTKGYHVGPNPPGGCVKDTPSTTTTTTPIATGPYSDGTCPAGYYLVKKYSQCLRDDVSFKNSDGTCPAGYYFDNAANFCFKGVNKSTTSTTPAQLPKQNNTGTGGGGNGTTTGTKTGHTTGGNKSSTTTPSPHTQSNKTSTNTNTVINQNTVRGQVGVAGTASPSTVNSGPAYTQTPSMSMWSLSLGKSTFAKEGLRLLANLKPFGTIGVPYTLDISFNLPSTNVSLIAAQITKAGLQHAVVIPINKTAEGAAGESLFQAEMGQTIAGINPFTRQPDTISGGGATDLLLFNNGNSDIVFNDDSGATMTLRYR